MYKLSSMSKLNRAICTYTFTQLNCYKLFCLDLHVMSNLQKVNRVLYLTIIERKERNIVVWQRKQKN